MAFSCNYFKKLNCYPRFNFAINFCIWARFQSHKRQNKPTPEGVNPSGTLSLSMIDFISILRYGLFTFLLFFYPLPGRGKCVLLCRF
jgi:hypothetical protein